MPSAAFQPNAFQGEGTNPATPTLLAFQTQDPTEVLADLSTTDYLWVRLGPPMKTYPRGSTIVFALEVRDGAYAPPVLANSGSTTTLAILNPDNTTRLASGVFTSTQTGQYTYKHQTSVADQPGAYPVQATIQSGGFTVLTGWRTGFVLVDK